MRSLTGLLLLLLGLGIGAHAYYPDTLEKHVHIGKVARILTPASHDATDVHSLQASEGSFSFGQRMAAVDRNLLRLALYELLYQPDIPTKVVINEAIELAKRYGSEESGAFVNGILDRIRQTVGRGV